MTFKMACARLCLFFILFSFKTSFADDIKCVSRDYGNGGTVCVCNGTYCDTVERLRPFEDNEYYLYISSRSGLRFEPEKSKFLPQPSNNVFHITVDPTVTYQKVYGFGGAFTDSACQNINSLNARARQKLIESYFSPRGIEYNLGRVPIGGTDFSTRKYTLDDVPKDLDLSQFQLSTEDLGLKIPVIRASQKSSSKKIRLIGAAWTAPPWMKTNNDYICFGLLKSKFYDLWSEYHLRFLKEYKRRGLEFWALSTGNEPTAGLLPYYSFNCMGWTPFSQSRWVSDHLGPRLANSRFNGTLIIGIDDQRFTLPWWPKIMFANKKTKDFVAGIGIHWYWDNYLPLRVLDWTHSAFPDKFILYTEVCYVKERGKPAVVLGSWERGEGYASSIIRNMNHFVGGWMDWNIALNLEGGPNWVNNVVDAPIIVNSSAGEFYKQPMYYALGHFSKFVAEGSVRVAVKRPDTANVDIVAFLTPERNIVLVLLNRKKTQVSFNVHGSPKGVAHFSVPEKSIATLIYKSGL